ncbi:MAG: DNA polymerase III subunit beta [Pseudomonadota bacterium]|nr:DNA polymerase III subunit beta [Pseudomonadota bacterium]
MNSHATQETQQTSVKSDSKTSFSFTLRNDEFCRVIRLLSGVVDHSQVIQVLGFLKISISPHKAIITASNSEIEMHTSISVVDSNLPNEQLQLTMPCKKLLDITKSLGQDAMLNFSHSGSWTQLRVGKTSFKLAALPAEDFPCMDSQTPKQTLTLESKVLAHALKRTQFCMASNDVRFFLNGLLFQVYGACCTLVATDGHRMACHELNIPASNQEAPVEYILPRKTAHELSKYLQDNDEMVELAFNEQRFSFKGNNLVLHSNLIDGKYPAFKNLIPKEYPHKALVDTQGLKSSLQKLMPLANEKYHGASFSFTHDIITITTRNLYHEEAKDEVPTKLEGEPISVGFNINYVLDILNVIQTPTIQICMVDPKRSVAIEEITESPESTFIVMPLDL